MDPCPDCGGSRGTFFPHKCPDPQGDLFEPVKGTLTADPLPAQMIGRISAGKDPIPPHVAGSDTSKAAAESMRGRAQTDHARVLDFITEQGVEGATADEVLVALALTHQNGSARVSTLASLRQIEDSGARRKTRSGRMAAVYVATGHVPPFSESLGPPSTKQPSPEDFRDFHSMVDILLRDETGGQRGPMTDRVMLWLKHLGEQ